MPAATLSRLVVVQTHQPAIGDAPWEVLDALFDGAAIAPDDLVLLPEHSSGPLPRDEYRERIVGLAKRLGCHVVGGSHHEMREDHAINTGIVADPTGAVVGEFDKLRPYARERAYVQPGISRPPITIAGRTLRIVICADFWFTDLLLADAQASPPDMVLVPAFSVTRKPTPDYARTMWRHMAVSRAYELGVYVGVSDWLPTEGGMARTSGVGGFADPTTVDPDRFFTSATPGLSFYPLDFEALDAFRADRRERGFFWTDGD